LINFADMQRMTRFARYWDMIANSGRFGCSMDLILGSVPFENFMQLSDWLYRETTQTHKFALERLFRLVYKGMIDALGIDQDLVKQQILLDFDRSGIKGNPRFLQARQAKPDNRATDPAQRQKQHIH
jgi:hypothetical protein